MLTIGSATLEENASIKTLPDFLIPKPEETCRKTYTLLTDSEFQEIVNKHNKLTRKYEYQDVNCKEIKKIANLERKPIYVQKIIENLTDKDQIFNTLLLSNRVVTEDYTNPEDCINIAQTIENSQDIYYTQAKYKKPLGMNCGEGKICNMNLQGFMVGNDNHIRVYTGDTYKKKNKRGKFNPNTGKKEYHEIGDKKYEWVQSVDRRFGIKNYHVMMAYAASYGLMSLGTRESRWLRNSIVADLDINTESLEAAFNIVLDFKNHIDSTQNLKIKMPTAVVRNPSSTHIQFHWIFEDSVVVGKNNTKKKQEFNDMIKGLAFEINKCFEKLGRPEIKADLHFNGHNAKNMYHPNLDTLYTGEYLNGNLEFNVELQKYIGTQDLGIFSIFAYRYRKRKNEFEKEQKSKKQSKRNKKSAEQKKDEDLCESRNQQLYPTIRAWIYQEARRLGCNIKAVTFEAAFNKAKEFNKIIAANLGKFPEVESAVESTTRCVFDYCQANYDPNYKCKHIAYSEAQSKLGIENSQIKDKASKLMLINFLRDHKLLDILIRYKQPTFEIKKHLVKYLDKNATQLIQNEFKTLMYSNVKTYKINKSEASNPRIIKSIFANLKEIANNEKIYKDTVQAKYNQIKSADTLHPHDNTERLFRYLMAALLIANPDEDEVEEEIKIKKEIAFAILANILLIKKFAMLTNNKRITQAS